MGRQNGRVRLKGLKGKRWQKGQSSSSNPQTHKHRNAARGKFSGHLSQTTTSQEPGAGVALTTDALASHDAIQGKKDDIQLNSELVSNVAVEGEEEDSTEGEEDAPSVSMTTTSTAYSLIETSHPVFWRVKKLWNSNVESHREICAVLAAASEVIKTNDGKETPTEYFGVLVTALESADNEKACVAISYLLSLVMPRIPVEVMQARYGTVCKILSHKLSVYEMSDLTSLLKYLVKCLTLLLGAQVGSIWSESSTQRVFQLLLNYTVHPKPKLRKASRNGVVSILREGSASGGFHPAARLSATHCIHILEKGGSETTILHTLGMLKDCMANINTTHLKSLCELTFKFVSVGSSVLRSTAFKTLHGLFSSVAGPQGLTNQDCTALILRLYNYQPNLLDAQLLNAWLTVMDAAHDRLPEDACLDLLPKFFSGCVDCLLADKSFVKETVASVMERLLKKLGDWDVFRSEALEQTKTDISGPPTFPELIYFQLGKRKVNLLQEVGTKYKSFGTLLLEDTSGSKMAAIEHEVGKNVEDVNYKVFQEWLCGSGRKPMSWDTLAAVLQDVDLQALAKLVQEAKCGGTKGVNVGGKLSKIKAMFKAVESGLGYKYFSSWHWVLPLLATFYQVGGQSPACQEFMTRSLVSLSELRSIPDFPHAGKLDAAFGAAIKYMGPSIVLNAVPLMLDQDPLSQDFPRSWILPVLKSHIEATELSYFRDTMMPLANSLGAKGSKHLQEGNALQAKLYSTLQLQVWSLLPRFCLDPVDLGTALTPNFARILGMTLKEAGFQFRKIICQALKQLISTSRGRDEDQTTLARFSKNFLPILFSLYTTPTLDEATPTSKEEAEKNSYLMDCIKAYLSITDPELIEAQFSKLLEKLRTAELSSSVKPLLLDLGVAFAPLLSGASLASLFNLVSPLLDSSCSSLQKKAYGCLEAILSGSGSQHQRFFEDHLEQLRNLLVGTLSTVSAGSKRFRLKCLLCVSSRLSPDHVEFIAQVTPEVILCIKEVNEKARVLAVRLVTDLGYAAQHCFGKKPGECVIDYFTLVLAGLAGSPHMVSCTLLALSKLVYEFHDLLGTGLIRQLIANMLVFLSSQKKEVVRSTLVLVKVVIGVLPSDDLAPHVESMVKSILSWGENKRNHFRLKCRVILERLIRKFDFEMVSSFVPKKHQKLMLHIRKTNERQQRKKRTSTQQGDGGSDESVPGSKQRGRKAKPTPSYEELLESSDEEEEEVSRPNRKPAQSRRKQPGGMKGSGQAKAWIKEEGNEDDPVNFMDPVAVKSILATNPARMGKGKTSAKANPFEIDERGKLVIVEKEGEGGGEEGGRRTAGEEEAMEVERKSSRKRTLDSDDDDDEDDDRNGDGRPTSKSNTGGGGIYRTGAQKLDFRPYGTDYKAKKAKGDVKKKGRPDPYAYIPLNRQKLNRRKKAKMSGEFSGIMKKAAKGSAAGTKHRHNRKR